MVAGHVQVVLDGQAVPEGLHDALRIAGVSASFGRADDVLRYGVESRADAVVVVASGGNAAEPGRMRALLERIAANPRATLVLQQDVGPVRPAAHPASLPVSYSTQAGGDDLAARITTMISMREALDALRRRRTPPPGVRERIIEQYREQLRLAARVQHELFSAHIPACAPLRIRTLYKPLEYVSGDIYDVRRLDEQHVAIALADAQGHGVSAGLLTVFIKRAWRAEAATGAPLADRLPREVLRRLNRELLEADLSDFQFVSAVYAVIHLPSGRGTLARGGAPYPIVRRAGGRCEILRPAGPLVGVVEGATYGLERFRLDPGDTLVFYSDGVETLSRPASCGATPSESVPPDEGVMLAPWYRRLGESGVEACLSYVATRHDTLRRIGRPLDDVTMLAATYQP